MFLSVSWPIDFNATTSQEYYNNNNDNKVATRTMPIKVPFKEHPE
jgi:hypothetical protein